MKRPKLAILGLILVFSDLIIWNIGLISMTKHQIDFYFYSVIAGMILLLAGYVLIWRFYSGTLAIGAVLLTFGINRVMAEVYYPPSSFDDLYLSHFVNVGYLFIIIGIPLIIVSLFDKK